MRLLGVKLGSVHTLKDLDLYILPGETFVGAAEPETYLLQVPFGDRLLNLSKAMDGKVHYKQRTIKISLKSFKSAKFWPDIQRSLESAFQGQWLPCVFDDDPSWQWEGLWTVEPQSKDKTGAVFTITGTCNPYAVNLTAKAGADWIWDTFNFETDTIYDKPTVVKSL